MPRPHQPNARLNEEQVYRILEMLDGGDIPMRMIAVAYGVSESNICLIRSGKQWHEVYRRYHRDKAESIRRERETPFGRLAHDGKKLDAEAGF